VNVGPREPLRSLKEDFKFNPGFKEKVCQLAERGYVGWRRVRGDGNCFYRAVGFGFLELLVTTTAQKRAEWITTFLDGIRELHFDVAAERSAHADLVTHIQRLRDSGGWEVPSRGCETTALGLLYQSMRDKKGTLDLALIRAMRHLSAKFLVQNRHDTKIAGGISLETLCSAQGYGTPEDFCRQILLPMGNEAEGVSLSLLPPVLGTNFRVAFLDRLGPNGVVYCDYSIDGAVGEGLIKDDGSAPLVHVQLRPGHYDLVYFGSEVSETLSPCGLRLCRQPTFGEDDGLEYLLAEAASPQPEARRKKRAPQRGFCA